MNVGEIIKEIKKLPNFLYVYYDPIGVKHKIILGGETCKKKEVYTELDLLEKYNDHMWDIYTKEILEQNDKHALVQDMKHIHNGCDYRTEKYYTLSQQEAYLNKLDNGRLEKIYSQIEMYKLARSLYKDYH